MIDKKDVSHIAKLARLKITDEESSQYADQLSSILKYFEQVSEIKTDNIEPLVTPTDIEAFWRPDEDKKSYSTDEMLANAPEKTGNLFTVPPVV